MNRAEKKLLRTAIYSAAHQDEHLWSALKRQIFDFGNQLYYPFEGDLKPAVQRAIARLSDSDRQALIKEWKNSLPPRFELSDAEIISRYELMIVEEVIERARRAAYRTNNW